MQAITVEMEEEKANQENLRYRYSTVPGLIVICKISRFFDTLLFFNYANYHNNVSSRSYSILYMWKCQCNWNSPTEAKKN